MRFLPNLRYGTAGYPDKVARRLRVVNITTWSCSAGFAWFALLRLLDPAPGMLTRGFVNLAVAIALALVPLLHRFNSLAAPLALFSLGYVFLFRTIYQGGMAGGSYLYYFSATAFGILLIGTEHVLITLTLGAIAAALIIVLHLIVPYSTGLSLPPGNFIMNVIINSAILFGVFFYAMRQVTRSEAATESLLVDVQDKSRQLETANKFKSHFLASASHDLRQPLHALNLFVAQLQNESSPAERSRLVGRIDAAVGSMNELFEALLDMTKLEAGILKTNPAEFPVARLLERVETTFADAARKKGLGLRVVGSKAWVTSDPILLERILLNLVSNAVRYTEKGGVVVGCRRRGEALRIDVCDTGAGIPEEQRQRIFGEFYQMAGTAEVRSGGLGLGLAIVDRLGRLLGHKVELDSRTGRGSRFSVTVPLAAQVSAAEVPAPASAVADPARGKRVLVIDDDTLVLDGMRGILQSWGCQVETATSGDAALAALAKNGGLPDLIISDSGLADGATGIEAIRRLRAAAGAPIPAFVITGDTAPERLREASENGFHLLHKPVSPMALRTTLNRLLRATARSGPVGEGQQGHPS
jgi:signal transduction histidine kinase/CheY-like chemotaxis protein